MPSIFSRLLGKRKHAERTSLLDGEKYEVVPKSTSRADSTQRPKIKLKEQMVKGQSTHGLWKRSSSSVPRLYEQKLAESVPILSLSLPEPKGEEKKSQGLGVVFEGITDGPMKQDDEALGEKRLTPSETLVLVQKTSEVICERGLKTLGVMRPHWFASPRQQEIQLKLIHRFLQTLSSQTNGSLSSPSPSLTAAFESELQYSRDPHDIAAVLRWGLRHLQLEGNSFGSSNAGEWYRTFVESERSGSYPPKAFEDILVPLLPASHTQLLRTILDLVSSLAAHSEENGISGNKLSKVLGWWIVSSRDVQGVGWLEFYAQWEAAAREFEHLFLAYIRAQDAQSRMPKRLTEIVKNYPFVKSRRDEDGIYLPRSGFSTRHTNALFVRVTVDKSRFSSGSHPLRIVEDAFKAKAKNESINEYGMLWEDIRKISSTSTPTADQSSQAEVDETATPLNLSAILADESIRLFSLVPMPDDAAAPTLSLFTPLPIGRARRSLSVGDSPPPTTTANGRTSSAISDKAPKSPPRPSQEPETTPDWQLFSSSGFESPSGLSLAASLWDNDIEVSQPLPKRGLGVGKRNLSVRSASSQHGSPELPAPAPSAAIPQPGTLTYDAPRLVKLDEAFIDFWADSLLDSIARTWPTFVVCQLKCTPTLRIAEDKKPLEWLVIERVATEPARPPSLAVKTSAASARAASPVQSSPTKSESGKSLKWGARRKRWSFFPPKHASAPAAQAGRDRAVRNAAKDVKVGELGEILREEDEGTPNGVNLNGPKVPDKHAEDSRDEVPPVPRLAMHVNGVLKPEESVATKSENVGVADGIEPPAVIAEHVQGQGLSAVNEVASDEPTNSTSPAAAQEDVEAPHTTMSDPHAKPMPEHKFIQEQLHVPTVDGSAEASQRSLTGLAGFHASPSMDAVQKPTASSVHIESEDKTTPDSAPETPMAAPTPSMDASQKPTASAVHIESGDKTSPDSAPETQMAVPTPSMDAVQTPMTSSVHIEIGDMTTPDSAPETQMTAPTQDAHNPVEDAQVSPHRDRDVSSPLSEAAALGVSQSSNPPKVSTSTGRELLVAHKSTSLAADAPRDIRPVDQVAAIESAKMESASEAAAARPETAQEASTKASQLSDKMAPVVTEPQVEAVAEAAVPSTASVLVEHLEPNWPSVAAEIPPVGEHLEEPITTSITSHDDVLPEPAPADQLYAADHNVAPTSAETKPEPAVPLSTEPEFKVPHSMEDPAVIKSESPVRENVSKEDLVFADPSAREYIEAPPTEAFTRFDNIDT